MSYAGLVWWVDNGKIGIGVDDGSGTISALSTAGETIYVEGIGDYPDILIGDLTDFTDEEAIPAEYHMALASAVIGQLYLTPGKDARMSQVFMNEYERAIALAQVDSSSGGDGSGIRYGDGVF